MRTTQGRSCVHGIIYMYIVPSDEKGTQPAKCPRARKSIKLAQSNDPNGRTHDGRQPAKLAKYKQTRASLFSSTKLGSAYSLSSMLFEFWEGWGGCTTHRKRSNAGRVHFINVILLRSIHYQPRKHSRQRGTSGRPPIKHTHTSHKCLRIVSDWYYTILDDGWFG